jgi:hypothetical protein
MVAAAATAPAAAQTPLTEHTLQRDGGTLPEATIADAAWLEGRWVGEGLGAVAEEVWLPPASGAMAGVFRLVREGQIEFYEILTLVEEHGSLMLRLKHFDPALVGWEEREESVEFPLVRTSGRTLWFDGLTMRLVAPDELRIWVAMQRPGEPAREALFTYRRAR